MSMTSNSPDWNDNNDDIFHYDNVMNFKKSAKTCKKADAPSSSGGKKAVFLQCGLLSRQQEFNELGAPTPQSGCYGCRQMGEAVSTTAAVPYEEIVALFNTIRECITKTAPIELAIYVATRYEAIRTEINNDLMDGEDPLPPWSAATVLEHIRNHNINSKLQGCNRMFELQQLTQVALNASVVMNVDTKEVKIDPVQGKMYMEYVKLMETLSKTDPNSKIYNSDDHVDLKTAGEGPIVLSGKRMFSRWKQNA